MVSICASSIRCNCVATSAHRTSLLALVDRIIVIEAGKVVADGPRDKVVEALRKGQIGRAG